jgi:hypothetical protein
MSRPKSPSERKRYTIRLTDEEKFRIEEIALTAGLTTSEFIRRCALGKRVRSTVNLKAMAELNRLGGLQKLAIMNAPEFRPQLNGVIREIVKVLKVLGGKGEV